jgi:hypothetical protein
MANEARIRRQPRAHLSPAIQPNFFHRSVEKWQQTSQLLQKNYRHTAELVVKYWPFLFHYLFSVLPIKVDCSHESIFQCPPQKIAPCIQTWRPRNVTTCELAQLLRSFFFEVRHPRCVSTKSNYKVYAYIVKHNYICGGMLFTICKAQLHVSATNVGHLQVVQWKLIN